MTVSSSRLRVESRVDGTASTSDQAATGRAHICHVITGLEVGGAEMMLYKLLSGLDRERFSAEVVSLTSVGPVGKRIQALGFPVSALGMQPRLPQATRVLRMVTHLRRTKPSIVQSWMYHADLVGGLAARMTGQAPVVWGIRQTLHPRLSKPHARLTARACARLSHRVPASVVCCAESVAAAHARMGYDARKLVVIPNGFDIELFAPSPQARTDVRQELGLDPDAPLVGIVARYDVKKGHDIFVEAAGILGARNPRVNFVICGLGADAANVSLASAVVRTGIRGRIHCLGRRNDVSRVTAALDVAVSTSIFGEGFSNALGEAMACGVPCVATDVGDARVIIGETGSIVPAADPHATAQAIGQLLDMPAHARRTLGVAARTRIEERFSLPSVIARFESLYTQLRDTAAPIDGSHMGAVG
jgi:glycosyltransferase involved in cell wall biosynthesis